MDTLAAWSVLRHKACPVKVSIKVVHSDKAEMVKHLQAGEETFLVNPDASSAFGHKKLGSPVGVLSRSTALT